MHLYNELNEIPIPDFAHPDGYRVYTNYPVGNGNTKKLYIGQYANKEEGTFYANENFRLYYPQEWANAYEKVNPPHYRYNVGMYAMTLTLSHKNRLYQSLQDCFGPLYGNAILDFAMYSIMERSNVAYRFKPAMEHEVIFSKDRKDDDWLSRLFNNLITEDMIHQFRIRWLQECVNQGIKKVWISIDGSNSDNECQIGDFACKAENKSGTNKTAISYLYAIDAERGRPVSFTINHGDEVDSKAFVEMCELLESSNLEIEGVIIDRGFLTHNVLSLAASRNLQFVVMLKQDTYGHTQMVMDYGDELYWNLDHLIGTDALFGISDGPRQVFGAHEETAYINLYFDGKNGSERKVAFANKIFTEKQNAIAQIAAGKRPVISNSMTPYLGVEDMSEEGAPSNPGGNYKVSTKDVANKVLYKKGFESIASSSDLGPVEVNRIYHLRDTSEKQFMICKSMIGSSVFRIHTDEGIISKEAICFIAAILRREISIACENIGQKPSIMLSLIDRPAMALMGNGSYKYIHDMKDPLEKLFTSVGCTKEDFETIAGDVNEREKTQGRGVSQYHRSPAEIRMAHMRLKEAIRAKTVSDTGVEPPADGDQNIKPVRRPGRPLGSKNKKTLEREVALKSMPATPKRKPGRPLGSKNKKTLAKEATGMVISKRKRGRPPGSKDKSPRTRRTRQELQKAHQDRES